MGVRNPRIYGAETPTNGGHRPKLCRPSGLLANCCRLSTWLLAGTCAANERFDTHRFFWLLVMIVAVH